MASEFAASLRHRTRHSRMDPSRARFRELSRLDTWEGFNNWGGRGYDNFVPGMVTKIVPSGDETT